MKQGEADQLLRSLTFFVDTYEDRREEMPITIDDIAREAYRRSSQGPIESNDRSVIIMAFEEATTQEDQS